MSKGAVVLNESNVEYYTPKYIVDKFGTFDYDPATTHEKAMEFGIKVYDTITTNGLMRDWTQFDRIWINPPFNLKHLFFDKACKTYVCNNRIDIFFLCPIAFLTTQRFHKAISAVGIKLFLPDGRIKFEPENGGAAKSPAFGSVIVKIQKANELKFIKL